MIKEMDLVIRRTMLRRYRKIAGEMTRESGVQTTIEPFARRGEIFYAPDGPAKRLGFNQVAIRATFPDHLESTFMERVEHAESHSVIGGWRRMEERRKREMKQYAHPNVW